MQHHYLHYSIFIKKEEEAEEDIVFNRKIREIIRWRLPFIMKKKIKKSICSLYDMLININNRYSLVFIGSPHKLLQKLIYYHVVTSIPCKQKCNKILFYLSFNFFSKYNNYDK